MTSANQKALRKLNYLYQICKAGERGFGVVAANVANRGLKLILKTCAQQRARFADELKGEIQRLGGAVSEQGILLLLGVIHRGRIDIFATLTIGAQNVENVVLGEALLGEKAAVNAYQGAMATILPAETRALLERQYQQVKETHEQVALLRGRSGKRLVVRLFDSEQDVEAALRALEQAGFLRDSLETVDVKQVTSVYTGKGNRVSADFLPEGFFVDRQRNRRDPGTLTYFVDYDVLVGCNDLIDPRDPRGEAVLRDRLPGAQSLGLSLVARPDAGGVERKNSLQDLFCAVGCNVDPQAEVQVLNNQS